MAKNDGTFEKKKPRHSDDVVSKNNTNIVYYIICQNQNIIRKSTLPVYVE